MDRGIELCHRAIHRNVEVVLLYLEANQLISCLLQLRCHNLSLLCNVNCKGYQRRRNIDMVEGAGHTVLAADGWQSETDLCIICAEQRRKRLAPALRIACHPPEILLEGEADPGGISTCRHDLRHGLNHRIHRSVVRTP